MLSTSPTKIKVRIPYNTILNSTGRLTPSLLNNGWGEIAINVKDKPLHKTVEYFIYYKAVPYINVSGIILLVVDSFIMLTGLVHDNNYLEKIIK